MCLMGLDHLVFLYAKCLVDINPFGVRPWPYLVNFDLLIKDWNVLSKTDDFYRFDVGSTSTYKNFAVARAVVIGGRFRGGRDRVSGGIAIANPPRSRFAVDGITIALRWNCDCESAAITICDGWDRDPWLTRSQSCCDRDCSVCACTRIHTHIYIII